MSLEQHQIQCVEAIEGMRQIPNDSVDMVLTDLPYSLTKNKWDCLIPFSDLWEGFLRIAKPGAVFALTASQPFTSLLVTSQISLFRHEWIWKKAYGSNFANTVREPFKEHESVLIFSRGKWTYNKQMQERAESNQKNFQRKSEDFGKGSNYGSFNGKRKEQGELRVPSSVQSFTNERGFHPTQKPATLFEYLIRTYTNEGDLVFDPCCGSGTTGVAAVRTNRRSIQFDISNEYCEIARTRLQKELTKGG